MDKKERRNLRTRAALVQAVVNSIIQNPSVTLTVETLQAWIALPTDAAHRILGRLAASGLVLEINKGVFVPGTLPGMTPGWR